MQWASSTTSSPAVRAMTPSIRSRKRSFAKRSGETSSRSISSLASRSAIGSKSSGFVELIVSARTPMRSAISIWLRISASSGETSSVGPAPRSRSSFVAMK